MGEHTFTSKLQMTGKTKDGNPRLRVSVGIRDYEFINYAEEVLYFKNMELKRPNGETVRVKGPRISKGTQLGKYIPHYIRVPVEYVSEHGLKANEPVVVKVEW